jgi:hypothetical protein
VSGLEEVYSTTSRRSLALRRAALALEIPELDTITAARSGSAGRADPDDSRADHCPLAWAEELKGGMIEAVLANSDAELGLEFLLEKRKP